MYLSVSALSTSSFEFQKLWLLARQGAAVTGLRQESRGRGVRRGRVEGRRKMVKKGRRVRVRRG